MGIKITDTTMTDTASGHSAHQDDAGAWSVSYLPGRTFTWNDAITALSIAEAVATVAADETAYDRLRPRIAGWADEIGVDAAEVMNAAARTPDNGPDGPQADVSLPAIMV